MRISLDSGVDLYNQIIVHWIKVWFANWSVPAASRPTAAIFQHQQINIGR